MSHLSDKDLDRLSREAAEQLDVEGTTSGWDALEKKLDREMPTEEHLRKRKWWRWLGLFLLLISISGLLLGLYFNNGVGSRSTAFDNKGGAKQQTSILSKQEKDGIPTPGSRDNEASVKTTEETSTAANQHAPSSMESTLNGSIGSKQGDSEDRNKDNRNDQGLSNTNEPVISTVKEAGVNNATRGNVNGINERDANKIKEHLTNSKNERNAHNIKEPNTNRVKERKTGTANEPNLSTQKTPHTPGPSDSKTVIRKDGPLKESKDPQTIPADAPSKIAFPIPYERKAYDINIASQTIEKNFYPTTDLGAFKQGIPVTMPIQKKQSSSTFRPFEIGIIAGSDFSNVKFKGGDKPGYNFGISLGYNLNARWQVNTGLIYTTKRYFAKGSDYKPLHDYWTNYVVMDYISGECSMWEIPILIRYQLTTGNRGKWFASTGLSSYLMKREKYEYYYTQNGVYQNRYRDYPSDEKYFLGIIHLSAGYEKKISDRFSLQLEPYIKMPLKGVGFGRMQLNSLGTNFSLKMNMGR